MVLIYYWLMGSPAQEYWIADAARAAPSVAALSGWQLTVYSPDCRAAPRPAAVLTLAGIVAAALSSSPGRSTRRRRSFLSSLQRRPTPHSSTLRQCRDRSAGPRRGGFRC